MKNNENVNQQKSLWRNDFTDFEKKIRKRKMRELSSLLILLKVERSEQLNLSISISSTKSNEKNSFVECRLWYAIFEKKCSISIDIIKRKVVNCCKQRTIAISSIAEIFDFIDRKRNRTTNSYVEESKFDKTVIIFDILQQSIVDNWIMMTMLLSSCYKQNE